MVMILSVAELVTGIKSVTGSGGLNDGHEGGLDGVCCNMAAAGSFDAADLAAVFGFGICVEKKRRKELDGFSYS